jgi:hypothetical protein
MLSNPEGNYLNYDNFAFAFVIVFQTCTLEGWTQIMILQQMSGEEITWIYNFLIAFIGSFVIINLLLAIVVIKFIQSKDVPFFMLGSSTRESRRIYGF